MFLGYWLDKVLCRCAPRLERNESGASLVEYTLLLVLVAIAAFVAMHFVGGSVSNSLNSSGNSLFNSP